MTTVRLSALVTEDHELNIKVPESIPPGRVELVIELPETAIAPNSARETARAKLAAAGLLVTEHYLAPGTRIPTDDEVRAAGILPPGARPSEELIDEDRNER